MTETLPTGTKSPTRRLTPSQRTLALAVVLLTIAPALGGPVGQVAAQQAGEDAAVVFTGSSDGTVRAIDTETQSQIWNFTTPQSTVWAVDVGPNGEVVYAGTQNTVLYAIDANSGEELWRFGDPATSGDRISSVAAGVDGNRVFFGDFDANFRAASASDGTILWNYSDGSGLYRDADVGPNGDAVYSNQRGPNIVHRHDVSTGHPAWNHSDGTLYGIDASSNGNTVYYGNDNGRVRAIGAGSGTVQWSFSHLNTALRTLADNPDSTELYVGQSATQTGQQTLRAVDTSDQSEIWTFGLPSLSEPWDLSVSPSGGIVYTGWTDGVMRAHDTDDGSVVWNFSGHSDEVYGVASTGALAGHELSGEVEDQRHQSVEGTTVVANGTKENESVTTAEDGTYSMTLLNGTYNVTASKDGYVDDDVTIDLESDTTQDFTLIEESAALSVRARHYMEHGERTPYSVTYGEIDSSGNFVRSDVTNSTLVTSGNTTVVTVDAFANELVATSNEKVNHRTHVWFNYTNSEGETFSRQHNVTVANATVDNLDVLPPVVKATATLGDKTIQTILIATGVAVVAAILAGAFSGIAAFTVILSMGWVMGIVPDGTIIVVVLTAAFIGMNVAGNVDYTVQR